MNDNSDIQSWPHHFIGEYKDVVDMDDHYEWCQQYLIDGQWNYTLNFTNGPTKWRLVFYFKYKEDYTRFLLTWG
jgi:hypothetical protein